MKNTVTDFKILPFEDIKKIYRDEWILIGNPEFQNTKVLAGIVVLHHKDKQQLALNARENFEERQTEFNALTTVFTGVFPKNRRIWI